MNDHWAEDEADRAWLLSHERSGSGPPISDARARHYAQLRTLIAELPALPAGTVQRSGWEQAVLAAINADAGLSADQSATAARAVANGPVPNEPMVTRKRRGRTAAAAAAAFAMLASVAIVVFMYRGRPQKVGVAASARNVDSVPPERSRAPDGVSEVTRGIHVEQARLGFDHAVQVRRSETAISHELRDGDTVTNGDNLRVSVRTSADAYLYLAFCADQHLYPSQRGVRVRAGDVMLVPEGGRELVIDDSPGSEVLYLIVSRNELSLADPDLAELVVATSTGIRTVDCGASLDGRLAKSTGGLPPTNVLRGESIPKKRVPQSRAGSGETLGLVEDPGDIVWYTADETTDPPAVVAADADGIAVVRYRFIHVAPEQADDPRKAKND